jgi:multisubunit Na+/H+ antiporter MnhB subunit
MARVGGAVVAFATAAATMVLFMFALSLVIARAQERTVKAIRARVARVRRWSGYVLAAVGLFVLASALFPAFFRQVLF